MVLKTVDGMPIHYHLRALLDRPDLVAVCADGSMLHASSATGRAWWWRPGTSTALVTSLFARPPVTEARKRQAIVQSLDARLAKFFSPDEYPPWPKLMPAFERDGAWCLPSGDGILEGTPDDVGRRPHYLVSRTGAVSPVAGVPANARIAGVGAREVYFKVESDDGLSRVARFRLVIETGRASGAL